MDEENFSEPLSDCVAVNEFCMQLEQAEALLTLAELRSDLRLLQLELAEKSTTTSCGKTDDELNQIIPTVTADMSNDGRQSCQRNA